MPPGIGPAPATRGANAHGFTDGEDRDVARRARAIRDTGWEVTGPILQPLVAAGDWPPCDSAPSQMITIELRRRDWELAIAELRSHGDDRGVAERLEADLEAHA